MEAFDFQRHVNAWFAFQGRKAGPSTHCDEPFVQLGGIMSIKHLTIGIVTIWTAVGVPAGAETTAVQPTPLVATYNAHDIGDRETVAPVISDDGASVAFVSWSDLVAGDSTGADVFVKNIRSGDIRLVSTGMGGAPADGDSYRPSISGDGRYVAFSSTAANLVPGDTNGADDVFVRDVVAGTTTRVSISSNGLQGNAGSGAGFAGGVGGVVISQDGRTVAFHSAATNLVALDTNGMIDVFVRDLTKNKTMRVHLSSRGEQANGYSIGPIDISSTGRFIAFTSSASNLVTGDTNAGPNENSDVFRHDRKTGRTIRVSVASNGQEAAQNRGSYGPAISGDGSKIVFRSNATNLTSHGSAGIFLRDLATGITQMASLSAHGTPAEAWSPAISGDGRRVGFLSVGDVVGDGRDVPGMEFYVKTLATGAVEPAALSNNAERVPYDKQSPSLSFDGRVAAFSSYASCFYPGPMVPGVYVHDFDAPYVAKVTYTGATQVPEGEDILLSATLTDGSGTPLPGRLVRFRSAFGSVESITNYNGIATAHVRNELPAYSQVHIQTEFEGDVTTPPLATCVDFLSAFRPTTLTLSVPETTVKGAPVAATATLVDAIDGSPLSGRNLLQWVDLNEPNLIGTTDANGMASFSFDPGDYGVHDLTVFFPGDGRTHKFSGIVKPIEVVWAYAFADDGGAGTILINPLTHELAVLVPSWGSSIKTAWEQTDTAVEWSFITSSDPELNLRGTFNFATLQFIATVTIGGRTAVLRRV
jgi:Tol biopolymer transport system component